MYKRQLIHYTFVFLSFPPNVTLNYSFDNSLVPISFFFMSIFLHLIYQILLSALSLLIHRYFNSVPISPQFKRNLSPPFLASVMFRTKQFMYHFLVSRFIISLATSTLYLPRLLPGQFHSESLLIWPSWMIFLTEVSNISVLFLFTYTFTLVYQSLLQA